MLGEIDYNLKPIQPQYFLCRPDRTIISKISEAFNDEISTTWHDINELELSIPFYIDVNHRLVPNKNIGLIRERYLIKVVNGNNVDWYYIKSIEDSSSDESDIRTLNCISTAGLLVGFAIRGLTVESYHAEQILNEILAPTTWKIDYIDADFKLTYRAFDFSSTNVLDAILTVGETYNAITIFNTDKNTISLQKPELTGTNKGLTFSWNKYLKSMTRHSTSEPIVTRLKGFGQDDMTFEKVNPTGQNYVESFQYFMYPFERDANRNVIRHSDYMSDSLCHALLDFEALIESKKTEFNAYLKEQQGYEKQLALLEVDMDKLVKNEVVVADTKISQQFDLKMFFEKYEHSGSSSRSFKLSSDFGYAVMIKVDDTTGVTVSLDRSNKAVSSNQWRLLGKVRYQDHVNVSISGGNTGVYIQVCNISIDEYDSGTDSKIIERYSLDNKEMQIKQKQAEIDAVKANLTTVSNKISNLRSTFAYDKNFTHEQMMELSDSYIITQDYSDSKYIDEQDLYDETMKKFKELLRPQLSMEIDIVNFLEIIEAQYDWKKMNLGDFVNIKYEPTGVDVTARIIKIEYDYEQSNISLTISNVKDVSRMGNEFDKLFQDVRTHGVTLDLNKFKYDKAVFDSSEMNKLFENVWNREKERLEMAINETVTLDHTGITVYDEKNPMRYLKMTSGAIGLTRSGGQKFETALSADGLIAEQVLGKIILGERVVIGDTTGVFTIEGSKLTIQDRCKREVVKLGLLEENPDKFGLRFNHYASTDCGNTSVINHVGIDSDSGFFIDQKSGTTYKKTLWTSLDGLLNAQNLRISDSIIADGSIRIGKGNYVFSADMQGIYLGSEQFSDSPFRVSPDGVMYAKGGVFQDGQVIVGGGNRVIVLDSSGFRVGGLQQDSAPAAIYMDGRARFKNVLLTKPDGRFLADTGNGKFDLNGWDLIGAGMIDTQLLAANIVTATEGFVSSLVAGKLSTLTNAALTDWSNYIRIESNEAKWITGKVNGAGTQKKLADGRALYWKNSTQSGEMTVDETEWPVLEYSMEEKVKAKFSFDGSGDAATPYIQMGIGDGATEKSGKGFINKPNGSFDFLYGASNTGKERSVSLQDLGIVINSDGGNFIAKANQVSIISNQNEIKISNGKASIVLSADGKITFNGTRYDFM
ncbi:phage tail protein [Paenibacillus sp. EKM102P]|uniref:phage tail spike protein n=1 Tax=unclassified Paenibacillus TaxID=185978 RepID=UPI00142E3833|nr:MULTISPECIES: phage tail spike protein [unclassified Paenibacillus]KAF6620430.1 phage tail protein [Paenibacillus sp. EKM101P]KAF6623422.1 phage tail protein [Paenibacillus sp. EKM102P]KAF6634016.1 phage tail protein [Paenibacillus sp. EKM10P]KAF6649542.1 phage tail protein [Paenibacillus sp. EKM11P]